MARKQSSVGEPEMQTVSVAVLPPRLPAGMAPPTRVGGIEAIGWDESLNWSHNDPIEQAGAGKEKKRGLLKRMGLTTKREHRSGDPDRPPFIMRQIPYDTWRKHYAKDAEGNYKGTLAPAEDCLLKPDDVAKWRLEAPKTRADKWTRGTEVLPVYAEVRTSASAPEYDGEHPPSYLGAPTGEPVVTSPPALDTDLDPVAAQRQNSRVLVGGKTAAEIIEEAKNRPKQKLSFKERLKQDLTNGALLA